MQTKVSMVIPCYNKVDYIDEMFQSIYDQTYDNLELILVNDGSSDGTKEKIDLWFSKFEKRGFDVVTINQINRGVGSAVHSGLKYITGEYICLPDCDDVLSCDYVSRMASILDCDPGIQWVQCNMQERANFLDFYEHNLLEAYLLHLFTWSVCCKMIRRSYFDQCKVMDNFIESRTTQESQISLALVLGGEPPYTIEDNLYKYRILDTSIMGRVRSEEMLLYQHWEDMKNLNIKMLRLFGADTERNIKLCEIIKKKLCWETLKSKKSYVALFEAICSSALISDKQICTLKKHSNTMSGEQIFLVFQYMLFAVEPKNALMERIKSGHRLIYCAAMSETAKNILGGVLDAGIRPDAFWDQLAIENSSIADIPLTKPDYDSITKEDTVIIFTRKSKIIKEIKELCKTEWIFGYDDIVLLSYYILSNEENSGDMINV